MGLTSAIATGFAKYTDFNGRASRSEFWWWVLFAVILVFIAGLLDKAFSVDFESTHTFARVQAGGWISLVVTLVLLLPSLAVTIRRLHDTGRSGWWALLYFVCCVGAAIVYIMCLRGSQSRPNKYGPPPLTA